MLNSQQQAIIDSDNKYKACIAGAGSGKTHSLVRLIKHDTERFSIGPSGMAAITFTRYAANELSERLDAIGLDTKEMFAGTIHAFCLNLLTDYVEQIGWKEEFVLFDHDDRTDIMKYIIKATGVVPKNMSLDKALDHTHYRKDLVEAYEDTMKQFNAIDLTMIIEKTVKLLKNKDIAKAVRTRYKAFYVDEFQDTYAEQIEILKLINPEILVVIGDPDQAIYEWNKAKPEYLVNIKSTFSGMELFMLETNYRSTTQIVECANRLVKHNRNRIDKNLVAIRDGEDITYSLDHFVPNDEFRWIKEKLNGQAAIICRKNATAKAIGDYLVDNGLKVNMMLSSKDITKKDHIKSIMFICKAALNKDDDYSLMKSIRFLGYIDAKELMSLYDGCIASGTPLLTTLDAFYPGLKPKLDTLYAFNDKIAVTDAYEFIKNIILKFGVVKKFNDQHRSTKIIEIEMFRQLVKSWKLKQQFKFKDISIHAFLRWVMFREVQDDMEKKRDGINIMTVHGSKGLEFDTVFIPHLFKGEFPLGRSKNIEEERRLLYVAITRAKHKLYVSSCDRRTVRNGYQLDTVESMFIQEMM